jgi:hypothetical protein
MVLLLLIRCFQPFDSQQFHLKLNYLKEIIQKLQLQKKKLIKLLLTNRIDLENNNRTKYHYSFSDKTDLRCQL